MENYSITHRTDAIKLRNYGRIVQDLVAYATTISDEKQRQAAAIYIARCMRQKNQIWNKDFESGIARLKEDIAILSDGKLSTDFPEFEQGLARSNETADNGNNLRKMKMKRTYKK